MYDYLNLYVIPMKIENFNEYHGLIHEISHSDTSKIFAGNLSHSTHINLLIEEISVQLSNSLKLYELGYFDNAYYSLRSANELATVMLDLSDKNDFEIQNNFEDFREGKYNKWRGKIIQELSDNGIVFKDVIDKMPTFKNSIRDLLKEINNVVHCNGQENFYCFRFHNFDKNMHYNKLEEFKKHFIDSIKVLAIMRLIVDPFPLLLTNDEMLYRCPPIMVHPFSDKMLSVIGQKSIDEFKKTSTYKSMKNWILSFEKQNIEVYEFLNYDFINLDKIDDIYSQKHLIPENKLKILDLCCCTTKIVEIIYGNGIYHFFTSLTKDEYNCNIIDLEELIKINDYYNISYDEIYVSVMNIGENIEIKSNDIIYIFHKEKLDDNEIKCIEDIINNLI